MSNEVVKAFLSPGPRAPSRSGSERSPSSQKDVVQPDVKLHQDCHGSSRQRGGVRGPRSAVKTLLASSVSSSHVLRFNPEAGTEWTAFSSVFPFVQKRLYLGYQLPCLKHMYLLKETLTLVFLLLILNRTVGDWTIFWGILTFHPPSYSRFLRTNTDSTRGTWSNRFCSSVTFM